MVKKIIVVGEAETGKTSIIQSFLEYEGTLNESIINSESARPKKPISNSDFSLKIVRIQGEKVRLQIWDQGSAKDADSTFHPLFTRHTAGCIVVANSLNL